MTWSYQTEHRAELGVRAVASIRSLVPVYVAGDLGNPSLELIEDASRGARVLVRLHAGEVDPRTGRKVEVAIDGGKPFEVLAGHSVEHKDVLTLGKPRELIAQIAAGGLLHLRVPVRYQGMVKLGFGIDGLDPARLEVPPPPR